MSAEKPTGEGIGQALPRKEDLRLLTGRGRYAADVSMPNMAFAAIERTPHASALIRKIDTGAAKRAPGVIAVFTGADFVADGRKPIPHAPNWEGPPDVAMKLPRDYKVYLARHLPMPDQRVRFVGEPVAMVIAETNDQVRDAAELVEVDYEVLPAVVARADVVAPGRRPKCGTIAPRNISLEGEVGNQSRGRRGFRRSGVCRAASTPGLIASPARRWSAHGHRLHRREGPLHDSAAPAAAWCASARFPPARWACRSSNAARCAATWAAISAPATPSFRNTRCCPGRRKSSAGR